MIEGVVVTRLDPKRDPRGTFLEVFSDGWKLPIDPRQWSVVTSRAGTLRGMHVHVRHDECVLPLSGRVLVGLYDLRPDSSTSGNSMMIELDSEQPSLIVFPPGIVHGWYYPVDAVHLQGVSEPYAEYATDDNLGCHYGDPELNLSWPAEPLLVAERARSFPPLATLRHALLTAALLPTSD
jgi:dTDP-4-dehydrorhamnose 3,5-epimerase